MPSASYYRRQAELLLSFAATTENPVVSNRCRLLQKSTKVSLLCSEMASPGERRYRKPLRSPSPLVERHSSEPL